MDFFNLLLIIHIVCGGTSLILGSIILCIKKGGKPHKFIGNIYFSTMLIASLVALPMSYLHTNYFLFIVGVFTAFMLLTGRRYLKLKHTDHVKLQDWILSIVMLFFGFAFLILGTYNLIIEEDFGIVLIVFGSISLLFVYQDYKNFKGKSGIKNYWLTTHLQRMIGSYIASVTAFLVVNITMSPGFVLWLLPTVVIVPLIVKWTRKYKKSSVETNIIA